jgi:hypothetical protein
MIDDLPLFQPTALQRRIIDAAVEIQDCTPDTVEFLHAVLCQVGMPRARTKERFFERNNGRASIAIEAGRLHKGGKWVEMPMPYGAKPRLALLHISSEAVRTGSGRIEIGESLRDFLLTLGLSTDGRAYAEMKHQMENLAACRMLLTSGRSVRKQEKRIRPKRPMLCLFSEWWFQPVSRCRKPRQPFRACSGSAAGFRLWSVNRAVSFRRSSPSLSSLCRSANRLALGTYPRCCFVLTMRAKALRAVRSPGRRL